MDLLRILCYWEDDLDLIKAWYEQQDAEIQAKTDAIIEIMQTTQPDWWRMPYFRRLKGACIGLSTLRVISDEKAHHRIFGFFGPNEGVDYTLVLPMTRDDDPDYSQSGPEAFRRRDAILQGDAHIDEWNSRSDTDPEA
jgi:hypothetical protein